MAKTPSASSRNPVCGFTFEAASGEELRCSRRGEHFCRPRSARAVGVFEEILVHTKGRFARQPFILAPWQRKEIIEPLFGQVVWSIEHRRYVRRYRIVWIELGRKNGKSELLAGIALILMVADDEEGAEVYGCAKDRDQARKVWDVAERMRRLSPTLRERLGVNRQEKRIFDEATGSFYQIITADAAGELGHNPHGVVFDEVLTQPSDALWNALRTAMGTREQPMMVAATTAGNDPASFYWKQSDEMQRVAEDPARAPHILVYIRRVPDDVDIWNEANWKLGNPALGDFKSVESMREEALEATNDPTKENAFRMFQGNQRVQQVTRHMPMRVWIPCGEGRLFDDESLTGKPCWGGLDLAATTDLAALAWLFDDAADDDDDRLPVLARFWVPEARVAFLDQHTGGDFSVWRREGLVTVTEGEVIDYDEIHAQIGTDAERFDVRDVGIDRWNSTGTTNWLEREGIPHRLVGQGYLGMSAPMKELMKIAKERRLHHGGNPALAWNADAVEAKQDPAENIKPVKPDRQASGKRIDGYVALVMAVDGWMRDEANAPGIEWLDTEEEPGA